MRYKQEAPFCVQIELTEGCNLHCSFCGLQGIREKSNKNYKFMTPRNAVKIAKEIANAGWNSRIEFAMHGEPTMNPDAAAIISIFRAALPKNQLMMLSNGGGLLKKKSKGVQELFDAGLNVLGLDDYGYVNIVDKIVADIDPLGSSVETFTVHYYPKDLEASPHRRWPKNTKALIIIRDISDADKGTHASLNNHCGAGSPLNNRGAGKRCAKPFREMSIRWNGNVALCCNSWDGSYKCGNIVNEDIDSIWNGEQFQTARKYLYHGMREFKPCLGCDALSYRVGFLPDKKGLLSLSKPNKKDREVVKNATKGRPYTPLISKITWEDKR